MRVRGRVRVEPSGPVPCDLAIFGEIPRFEEQQQGRGFVGKSGKELWSGMSRWCGLSREQFYISNLVKEGLPKSRDPKPAEIAAALLEFVDELERVRPKIVVTAGAFATRALLGRGVRIADVHGIPHRAEIGGRQFLCHPIYNPAAGLHNKGFLSAFAFDLDHLNALLRGNLRPWAPSDRPVCCSWLSEALWARRKAPFGTVVAVDTEGWVSKPWGLSFSVDGERAYLIRASEKALLREFGEWLRDKVVVGHNFIHDVPVLRAMGVEVGAFHDTQVLGYHDMIRTGSGVLEAESQNLGTLAYREVGMVLRELEDLPGVDFETQMIPYSDEVRDYAGADAIATRRLFDVYARRGVVDTDAYQIDMGQVPLVEEMIATGIPFDRDDAIDYYYEVLGKLSDASKELKAQAARFGNRDFNPASHLQVREILTKRLGLRIRKRTKGGQTSTNEKALADFKNEPFVERLQTFRELNKLKGTYLLPLLKELQ